MKKYLLVDIAFSAIYFLLYLVFKNVSAFAIINGIIVFILISCNGIYYRKRKRLLFYAGMVTEVIICLRYIRTDVMESYIIPVAVCFSLSCLIVIITFININKNFMTLAISILLLSVTLLGQIQYMDYAFATKEDTVVMVVEDKYVFGMYGFYDYYIDLNYKNSDYTIKLDSLNYTNLAVGNRIEITVLRGFFGYHYLTLPKTGDI